MGVDSINSTSLSSTYGTEATSETIATNASQSATTNSVMDSTSGTSSSDSTSTDSDLPVLTTPITTSTGFSGLSLESLVTAIGNTESKQACAEGVDRMERRADKINENNQLILEEMADNLETMKKQDKLNGFMKAFQWIGAVLGTVASIGSIVVGCMTGNGLLIAGGIMGVGMAIDSMVSLATDGEKSLAQALAKGFEKAGMSEDAAYWLSFAINTAITLTTIGLSMGGAIKGAAKGVDATRQILAMANKIQCGVQIVSSLNTIATGASSIASSTFTYQLAKSQAEQVDIQAILEQIKMAQEFEEAMIQAQMERSNDLVASVNDIVAESNSTAMTIMASAPTMA